MLNRARYAASMVMIGGNNVCAFQFVGLLDSKETQKLAKAVTAANEWDKQVFAIE